jgi:hypothetical protein
VRSKWTRPHPIATSPIQPPAGVRFLLTRVMREILTHGAIENFPDQERGDVYTVDLEKLRIVIGKAMAISHRMGMSAGRDERSHP